MEKQEIFAILRGSVIVTSTLIMSLLIACSGSSHFSSTPLPHSNRGSLEAAARETLLANTQSRGIPYRDEKITVISDDGTYAKVRAIVELRPSAESDWQENEIQFEFAKVAGIWRIRSSSGFILTASERAKQEQAAAQVRATQEHQAAQARAIAEAEAAAVAEATKTAEKAAMDAVFNSLKIIPYGYTLRDGGDGWKYGSLFLAFENRSDAIFVDAIEVPVQGTVVETQQGPAYEVSVLEHNYFYKCPTRYQSSILGSNVPVPSGFRIIFGGIWTSQWGGQLRPHSCPPVEFKVPAGTNPTVIRIPNWPSPIDLSSASRPAPRFPTDSSPDNFPSIAALRGEVILDEAGGILVTFEGKCIDWQSTLLGQRSGVFVYRVVNRDNLAERSAEVRSPTIVSYYPDGRVEVSGVQYMYARNSAKWNVEQGASNTLKSSLGPGQEEIWEVPFYFREREEPLPQFFLVVPPGGKIQQGQVSGQVYRVDCSVQ